MDDEVDVDDEEADEPPKNTAPNNPLAMSPASPRFTKPLSFSDA